jgi:hypothetical protein
MMQRFSVWMLDELGEEYCVTVDAQDWSIVLPFIEEQYPESSIELWSAKPVSSGFPAHHTLKG